jgi:putative CocE/NonD family hydrolase
MRLFCLAILLASSACARGEYTKVEYRVPMRDGVKLYTVVYIPKDASDANQYPILLKRTMFSAAPYDDAYPKVLGPNAYVMHDKYIFAYQDIRGRYMSEGTFVVMRPYVADSISEASDAYDTIAWLLAHVPHNTGRVGAWGTSYAGFLASMAALSHHPALVVASPQAPATDSYFEDFHHNGALTQGYFYGYPYFVGARPGPVVTDGAENDYAFQLALGPLQNTTEKYYKDNAFWQDIVAHPNYDAYWQSRAVPPDLTGIHSAMLIAGGWFDAENLYGTLATYKALVRQDSAAKVTLVMGPWRHNGWEVPNVDSLEQFQRDVEAPYFRAYLKGDGTTDLPAALLFDTGRKQWRRFTSWPASDATTRRYYFHADSSLSPTVPTERQASLSYVSDPAQPAPSRCKGQTIEDGTLNHYMSDDQRCYRSRPDVVTFETAPLTADVTFGGEIWARLNVSTTGTDADYVVKLIDVYPQTDSVNAGDAPLVRGEIMRARFRQSFAEPQPMRPDAITPVAFQLQDVLHTFRAGHRIMVQVQSSWFPAFDRNPQKYVPNIYKADSSDFIKATERVWVDGVEPSYLDVQVVPSPRP